MFRLVTRLAQAVAPGPEIRAMLDIILCITALVFFAVTAAYADACDRL